MESSFLLMELLRANHVDVIIMDGFSSKMFVKNNPGFSYKIIAKDEFGSTIALQKNSPLVTEINQALDNLEKRGVIKKLEEKWFN